MFKKSAILEVGGYIDFPYFEDYFLWIRVILRNKKICNVNDSLVNMRASEDMRKRRGGKEYRKSNWNLKKYMLQNKYINAFQYVFYGLGQNLFSILGPKTKNLIYKAFLRKPSVK